MTATKSFDPFADCFPLSLRGHDWETVNRSDTFAMVENTSFNSQLIRLHKTSDNAILTEM